MITSENFQKRNARFLPLSFTIITNSQRPQLSPLTAAIHVINLAAKLWCLTNETNNDNDVLKSSQLIHNLNRSPSESIAATAAAAAAVILVVIIII